MLNPETALMFKSVADVRVADEATFDSSPRAWGTACALPGVCKCKQSLLVRGSASGPLSGAQCDPCEHDGNFEDELQCLVVARIGYSAYPMFKRQSMMKPCRRFAIVCQCAVAKKIFIQTIWSKFGLNSF